jgi:hypothetical protein
MDVLSIQEIIKKRKKGKEKLKKIERSFLSPRKR